MHVADEDGNTPLHFAVIDGGLLNPFIGNGADVNATNVHGCSPLHLAAYRRFTEHVIKLPLKAGASVHCQDNQGNTPLHVAIARGNDGIAEPLIQEGSDVNATTYKEEPACTWRVILILTEF